DKRAYPTTLSFGGKLCENNPCLAADKVYMQKVPNDPSSGNYQYLSTDGTSYRLYACMENNLQMLPYISLSYTMICGTYCNGSPGIPCVWGVSSSNISP
ncbi:MAG TPA: hypothetical protein VF385_01145, partial [Patescibacteria group bacterium]